MSPIATMAGVYDPVAVAQAARSLVVRKVAPQAAMQGLGTMSESTMLAAGVFGLVAVILAIRGAMGWYVGKQFGRPVAGAVAGGLLGAPGLGITALFGKGS